MGKDLIKKFDKIHLGKRGFIIGGGESIKTLNLMKFNFSKLFKEEITIGTNRSYQLNESTYHVVMDAPYFMSEKDKLNSIKSILFINSTIVGHREDNCFPLKKIDPHVENECINDSFSDSMYFGKSSGYMAMNVANCLGLNPIYLVGIDLVGKHFHKGYGKDKELANDHLVIEAEFRNGIKLLQDRGIVIISLSEISKLNNIIKYDSNFIMNYLAEGF